MKIMTIEEFRQAQGPGVSALEAKMALLLWAMDEDESLPEVIREHKFHPDRRWRFDFAFPHKDIMLAIECEGGTRKQTGGGYSAGHGHPDRFESDCEKYNEAAISGWRVLRFTAGMIDDARATMDAIARALGLEKD